MLVRIYSLRTRLGHAEHFLRRRADSASRSPRPYGEEGTAETSPNRVEHGRGHGLSNGFAYPQRSRKATPGCLMPSRSARTCGLASK